LKKQSEAHEAKMKAKREKLSSLPPKQSQQQSISSPSSISSANVQHKKQKFIWKSGPYSSSSINLALQYLADKAKIIREHSGDHRPRLVFSQQSSFYKPLIESPEYKEFIAKQTMENLEKLINKLYIGSKLNIQSRSYLGDVKKDLLQDFLRLIQLSPTEIDQEINTLDENGKKMHTALWNQSGTWEEKVGKAKLVTDSEIITMLNMFFPYV
jgi:hypothetical protein